MSLNRAEPRTPTAIPKITVKLEIGPTPQESSAEYRFVVYDQNGDRMSVRQGDAWPHFTPAEQAQLAAMASRVRGVVAAAVLGP